ncbi:tryptophan synthase subunit beta [Mycoplasmopsis californica]|uniref:Tryptophan synthase beta chain n=1 Tax=Mycoplasmopsis californica TaxID=2113 RepID=A0A059XVJ0_9BACT|nr:tryptophan synthase subunit beta [Mycoplasmopsis californica]AIA29331.1 tryptophan synthase subunit beta [Mycoplasmopsis californica]
MNDKLKKYLENTPNEDGFFGEFGGAYLPADLEPIFAQLAQQYKEISQTEEYKNELIKIRKDFQGRPTPIYFCQNLSAKYGKARIHIKREDLNEGGSHKTNHCLAEALFAKMIGKTKLIAETGAGSHGAAVALAAAHFGLECEIHMGAVDIAKQQPNVEKMKILGAKVIPATHGAQTLKEAVDSAFEAYRKEYKTALYAIGSVVGPHPFPLMVRNFQKIISEESREQFNAKYNKDPDYVVACVGGGSNAIGSFTAYLFSDTKLVGVEPLGKGPINGQHASTLTFGKTGILHGFKSILLADKDGNPDEVYSIASGLDYPGVGPEHSYLQQQGLATYEVITDNEALEAFLILASSEGIIPALESSHALAQAIKIAKQNQVKEIDILVTLSGRGDKDLAYILENYKDFIEEFRENHL